MMAEERTSRARERAAYIEALPDDQRATIKERIYRSDMLGGLLCYVEEYPEDSAAYTEMVEYLRLEVEEARASQRYTLRAFGVPEL